MNNLWLDQYTAYVRVGMAAAKGRNSSVLEYVNTMYEEYGELVLACLDVGKMRSGGLSLCWDGIKWLQIKDGCA